MSYDALREVLEELPDPSYIEGTTKLGERLAIQLADGDVGALDDASRCVAHEHVARPADDEVDAHEGTARMPAARSRMPVTVAAPSATTAVTSSTVMGTSLSPAAGLATRHRLA